MTMEAFVSRKRQKIAKEDEQQDGSSSRPNGNESESTDERLAILASIFEEKSHEELLHTLLDCDGSVERATDFLLNVAALAASPLKASKESGIPGIQSSLTFKRPLSSGSAELDVLATANPSKLLTKKNAPLYLYEPSQIASQTPCTIIHNFLPAQVANDLLSQLLSECKSFKSETFRIFDKVVSSPHTAALYLKSLNEAEAQKDYLYFGSTLTDVRELLPIMKEVSLRVQKTVNEEIEKRITTFPGQQKLKYQHPPGVWEPNAAFVNCYDGPQQNVGWHTDQLTYLGPHATIGSLSLGVQREFRIRRIVPPPDRDDYRDEAEFKKAQKDFGDLQGQISIPLPHNSLLIMHADMQESWKHSISPISKGRGLVPHSIGGQKRLNITYRWYRDEFRPQYTPTCKCKSKDGKGVPCVLKSVMRRKSTAGQYMWMCQTPGRADEGANAGKGCGYFEWAEFDDDGVPVGWKRAEDGKGEAG